MFVYIIGNSDKNVFKLGVGSDPFQILSSLQGGNPYKLAILCKLCVSSKNEANLIEQTGHKELKKYEGAGGWYADIPEVLSTQFVSDHYLRLLASKVGVVPSSQQFTPRGRTNLQRLTPIAKRNELSLEDALARVEKAYDEGISIDSLFEELN